MKLRALIVDDERIARQRLRRLLNKEYDVEVVAEAENGPAAVERVSHHQPDVVFLDIQMPGMNGFEVVEFIQPIAQPVIVFVTAYDKHAVHAFETCAVDYLLKPFAPARLKKTLDRVRHSLRSSTPSVTVDPGTIGASRYAVRNGQRTTFVAPEEVDWIEADGNYAILHVGSKNHLLRETMSNLESQLSAEFMRVSRSAIVHLSRVQETQSTKDHRHFAILQNGQRIAVTRSIREVEARLRLQQSHRNTS
jgi:two-component system LytT family response regulator